MKACKTIFISALLSALTVFAGPSVIGNGGNGVFLENKFYVLDLVESSSHKEPFIKDSTSTYYYDRLKYALHDLDDPAVVAMVSRKIMELGGLDLIYTESLIRTFEAVRWNVVDYRLTLLPVITPVAAELHQIAIRTSDNILIDRYYWTQLNPENRAALLFHEANFILIRPSHTANDDDLQKSAFQSRLLTGYIFSHSMGEEYPTSFSRRLAPLFPSELSTVNDEPIFTVYKTKALSPFAFEDVLTANPYLEITFRKSKTTLSLNNVSKEDLVTAICQQTELPELVKLYTHITHLELYKGDNNSEDYLSFVPASDEGFPELKPLRSSCLQQVAKMHRDLALHID